MSRRVEGLGRPEDLLEQVAAQKLAPSLGAFVQWVLGRAMEDGISRLYFLARDGWFPYVMARQLCQGWKLPLECRYLFGSRYSWQLPLYHLDHQRARRLLCKKSVALTPEKILSQAGLSPEEQKLVFREMAVSGTAVLSQRERKAFETNLSNCPQFWTYLDDHSRKALPNLKGYFQQAGLMDKVPWALVDSGWMGSTQETLAAGLQAFGWNGTPMGYYAGLYRGSKSGKWDCFFFHPGKEIAVQAFMEPSFFEGVFSAPHGMTMGYKKEGKCYVPVLKGFSDGEPWKRLGRVFQAYGALLEKEGPPKSLLCQAQEERLDAWEALKQVMTRPSVEEARVLGQLPFSDSPLEAQIAPLAAPLTEKKLGENHLLPRLLLGTPGKTSAWLPGSGALYGKTPIKQFQAFDRVRFARVLFLAARNYGHK